MALTIFELQTLIFERYTMNFIDNQINYFAKKNENSIMVSNEELYAYLLNLERTGQSIDFEQIRWIISLVQQNTIIQSSFSMRREGMENERTRWLVAIAEGHLLLDWASMSEIMKDKLELYYNENIYHQELKPTWKLNSFVGSLMTINAPAEKMTYENSTYLLQDLFTKRNKDEDYLLIRKKLQDFCITIKKQVGTYKATIKGQFIDYREFELQLDPEANKVNSQIEFNK